MRFYNETFASIRSMPIKVFWSLNRMIERVRSDEILAEIPAYSTIMGGEHVEEVVENYRSNVGKPMISEQLTMGEEDRRKLRAAFGPGGNQ